jgi:hypoxanthine phosphoribosyltransferase
MEKERYFMTWDEYEQAIWKLKERMIIDKVEYIIGIAKGGVFPTVHLANLLNVDFGFVHSKSYEGQTAKYPKIMGEMLHGFGGVVGVIDDLVDSGQTKQVVMDYLVNDWGFTDSKFYTLVEAQKEKWIVFPWENLQVKTNPFFKDGKLEIDKPTA